MVSQTILYAEDSADDVFIFNLAFKRAALSHHLYNVDDGQQAIECFQGVNRFANRDQYPLPQILLTDIKMPRKNGFELLKWVRSQEAFAKIPVVVLSSSDEPRDVKQAYELGATAYFVKTPQFQDVILFLRAITLPSPK
ncbi:MAG: response regulator receiver protein [Verrucomicrobiales bacterium]|nr:response regulator receiver protein [Verrucomicrobiales bacterium]